MESVEEFAKVRCLLRLGFPLHRPTIWKTFLWQLMRFNMLQLLKNLRSRSQGKEFTDADILNWANKKVKIIGRTSHMDSFKDKNLSNGLFFLELLSAVEPRVVSWNLVTKGESDEEKKLNATYIITVAQKLDVPFSCLPKDIMEAWIF